MEHLTFGKKTIQESYFNDKVVSTRTTYSVPMRVQTKAQALNVIMEGLNMLDLGQTPKMTFTVETNPKTKTFKMVTQEYPIDYE